MRSYQINQKREIWTQTHMGESPVKREAEIGETPRVASNHEGLEEAGKTLPYSLQTSAF